MTIEVATCVFVDIFSFMLDFEIDLNSLGIFFSSKLL